MKLRHPRHSKRGAALRATVLLRDREQPNGIVERLQINFLSSISPADKQRVRALLQKKLEARRTPTGIQLERYLVFASAPKPA